MSVSLSIRPWRLEYDEQSPVIELLDRVNRERGHFRDIVDASLQEEIATTGALQLSDSEEEQEENGEPNPEDGGILHPTTREELYRAKFDMLQKVSVAHNEVMMALDFISLLESKDAAAGKQTMSQFLKDNIPPGTLGTDIWQRMPKDAAREAQDASLAYNVRMEALQKSADSILGAAKTLEDNARKEARYWNEILSVTEAGWNVCRLPGQRHKLAVRFGLSESSAEFSRGGIAALTADDEGAVSLDRGVEVRSKAVRVTVRQDRELVGRSKPVAVVVEGQAVLDSRIKHARDALFDEELFRELEREGRSMIAAGVQTKGNNIIFPLVDSGSLLTLHFELLTRNEASAAEAHDTRPDMDCLAHGVLCTAKLLLCQAHRDQLKRRSAIPAPLSEAKRERPLLRILRPLLVLSIHQHTTRVLNDHLEALAKVLRHAGIDTDLQLARMQTTLPHDVQSSEALLSNLLLARSNEVSIELHFPVVSVSRLIKIRIETSSDPECKTVFVLITDDTRQQQATDIAQAILELERILANQLAKALAASSEHEWHVGDDDAYLSREELGVTGAKEAEVIIDGRADVLRLISQSFRKQWIPSALSDLSIWQAWKELA